MSTVATRILRRIRRSWSSNVDQVGATREHFSILRVNLRELRVADRELSDALRARVLTLEERLEPRMQTLIGEWDAIEKSPRSRAAKSLALRGLYLSLAEKYARTAD